MRMGSFQAPVSEPAAHPVPQRPGTAFWPPAWLGRLIRSDRRNTPRHAGFTGSARVGTSIVPVVDLSRTGFQLRGFRGLLSVQDRFGLSLDLAAGDAVLTLTAEAVVAWRTGDRLGAAFYALSAEERQRLDGFLALLPRV